MLDTQGQIDAFNILNHAGLIKPAAVILSREAEDAATNLATTIGSLIQPGISYPSSVSAYTSQLPAFTEIITQAANAASALAGAISPYCTPSDLLQIKLGWECHVKAASLSVSEPFPLVAGMGDEGTPRSLKRSVYEFNIDELREAMTAVNNKLSNGTTTGTEGGAGAGGAPVPLSLSDEELLALKTAVESAAVISDQILTATAATQIATSKISESTVLAAASLQNAVAITLTGSMMTNQAILPALSLLMPAGVIESLKEE